MKKIILKELEKKEREKIEKLIEKILEANENDNEIRVKQYRSFFKFWKIFI